MLDRPLRLMKEELLTPLALRLTTINPGLITLFGLVVGLVGAAAVWHQYYLEGLGLWCLNRLLDGLDGTLARVHNRQSDLGGYLDILADFVIYAAYPVALVASTPTSTLWLALALLLSLYYINTASWMYLAAILEKREAQPSFTTVQMPDGIMDGTMTFIFYVLFLLFPSALLALFAVMGVLIVVSIGQRLVWAWRIL